MPDFSLTQINLFKSLFKGREDVFAIRWEKDKKSGYIPAYDLDWNEYKKHKGAGGSLKDFKHKEYSKLTDERILNHLIGKEIIGIYPLLPDNTSWFVVADFDEAVSSKRSWMDECRMFLKACDSVSMQAYLERSRSGKGGHVWIFFDRNYYKRLKQQANKIISKKSTQTSAASFTTTRIITKASYNGKQLWKKG